MKTTLDFIAMTVGAWAGWALGVRISFFVAFIASVIGTGLGMWVIRRYVRPHLP
jgi:hypothetical protein